ncbi:hypothetical protein Pint_31153 [Pistacia integerrima]|uniref:Uncharacterized protein n=1 Tax=Pistacia integerrima TaxID=434235 RepID=A0ACC0XLL9_9ROSI|nr:hypothetical protein Pint_31153 [Pistacia integerrima]
MKCVLIIHIILPVFLFWGFAFGKECTNKILPGFDSQAPRASLVTNETWKQEMLSQYQLNPTNASVGANDGSWESMYKKMKNPGEFKLPAGFLQEVSLHDVRLGPNSLHWRAQETNLEYLLMLEVDRLVWSFRKTADLPTPGIPYGGWENSTNDLRGHFVGHYLSASALMWASTHNETLKEKMSALMSALSDCQKKIGSGYLSAFPSDQFDRLENLEFKVWAPYYTMHKIMTGLLDQYTYAHNTPALNMTIWMAEYFTNRVQNAIRKYSLERHYQTLNEESGGMNDVLYRLYNITRDKKHFILARLFDKPCFLGPLAMQDDFLSGFHANTHIALVVGTQRRYEITGDAVSKTIGTFFLDIVNSSHSYATGGTSAMEFWQDPMRLATTLSPENEESCTTYNMLKVSRYLLKWTKSVAYADYYERALTNGVFSIQRGTDPGIMIYTLPLGAGTSKANSHYGWGTKFDTFWCCYGTGIESFSKLGDSIYYEEGGNVPALYIVQYVSSSINWKSGRFVLHQTVDPVVSWDSYLRLTITFSSTEEAVKSTLNFRIPSWTFSTGIKATLNNENLTVPAPGNYLSVTRKWSSSDKLTLQLPIYLWTEAIKDDRPEFSTLQAILYGPYLLAGYSSGDWEINNKPAKSLSEWIIPVPASYNSNVVTLSQVSGNTTIVLTNNQSVTMEKLPVPGTNASVYATFRLIFNNATSSAFSSVKDVIGKSVSLEPFDLPGMLLQLGPDEKLVASNSPGNGSSFVFQLVAGLDGKPETVSLELESRKGCFVYSGVNLNLGAIIELSCNKSEPGFNQAASFAMGKGMSEYHPISFVARGEKRNFLLAPIFSFRDESYTVYFKIKP